MKGLLLRVGIDKEIGWRGRPGPIFQGGSFEYIPIPETLATSETDVYKTMKSRCGRPLTDFVKKSYWYSHTHHAPEFTTYTYGDPAPPKRDQLSLLCAGDMLIFYAGLQRMEGGAAKARLYVIGYFTAEKVYDFRRHPTERDRIFSEVPDNAHSKQYQRLKALGIEYDDSDLVIVRGCRETSELLTEALPLGDDSDLPLQDVQPIIGYRQTLRRAVGHWVYEHHMQKVKEWLGLANPKDNKNSRGDMPR